MATKSKSKNFRSSHSADRAASGMNLKDLQRACIARGMGFEEVVNASVLDLHSWFNKNYSNGQNLILLNDFDNWKEIELKKVGYTKEDGGIFHPDLRLGFIGHKDDQGNTLTAKKPRLKGLKRKEKSKRERLEGTNVFSGTKKALTYQLASQGVSQKDTITQVIAQFHDAKDKSISIWYKRALNEAKARK